MRFSRKKFTQRHKGSIVNCCILTILLTCFLMVGCDEPKDDPKDDEEVVDLGFIPIGEWADEFGGSYKITTTNLEFDDGYNFTKFNGTIEIANNFTNNSGVLIIKVNTSETGITENNYIGVYYKDYTLNHILLANAIDESYAVIEVNSLDNAKKLFNVDNVSTHVTFWGSGYNK